MIRVRPLSPWQDPRGGQIERVYIDNGTIAMEVISLGGIIRSLWVPNNAGDRGNVVLGCDNAEDYLQQQAHLGAIAGRYANRIAGARMQYQGQDYALSNNHQSNCLHGGEQGFNRKNWHMGVLPDGVRLSLLSPDGDMGFPGNCNVQLDYRLVGNNLYVEIFAATDKACPISLTQHSYFNLGGILATSNQQHQIQINASQCLALNQEGIPYGVNDVEGSILDLRLPQCLGSRQQASELASTNGYDHCYLLEGNSDELTKAAVLSEASQGRSMTLYTNQPSVQLYGANFLAGTPGRKGKQLQSHQGVCLEPQQLPDGPNQSDLPGKPWVEPNECYHHISRYQFDTF